MTSDQFVYWLKGYLNGIQHDESSITLSETLEAVLAEVIDKNNKLYYKGC